MGQRGRVFFFTLLMTVISGIPLVQHVQSAGNTVLRNDQPVMTRTNGRSRFGRPIGALPNGACPSGMQATSAGCVPTGSRR